MPTSFCIPEWSQTEWNLSNVRFQGKIVDPCILLRRRKCVYNRRGNWRLFATISGWTILQISVKWRAYVVSGGVPTRLHDQFFFFFKKKKRAPLERHPLSPKKKLFTSACTTQTESHEANITAEIPKPMNFSYPCRWNQWKHQAEWHQLGFKYDRLQIL